MTHITGDTEWISIPGFNEYWINAQADVLSRRQNKIGKILKTRPDEKGYLRVTLYDAEGDPKTFKVHNLVALVFLGPRPDGLVTRHWDGNNVNNVPSNLFYGTYTENAFDQVRHGTHPEASRTRCDQGHEFTPQNTMRRKTKHGDVRKCKECHRITMARYRARKKAGLV